MLMNMKWNDFDDYMKKYRGITVNIKVTAALESWLSYLDGLGILVREGMIDLDMVYNVAYSRNLLLWFKFETVINEFRKERWNMPDYCQSFEYLANKII